MQLLPRGRELCRDPEHWNPTPLVLRSSITTEWKRRPFGYLAGDCGKRAWLT